MTPDCNTHALELAFLMPALLMSVLGPIMAIISQLIAYVIIKRVAALWQAYKNRPHVVPTDNGSARETLP